MDDLEAAARSWSAHLGIGPFFIAEYGDQTFDELLYRGQPGHLRMKTAICYAGDEQIELIQPLDNTPNAYRDTFPHGGGPGGGFHHLCFWSDDLDADLDHYTSLGHAIANVGRVVKGPRFAYVDTRSELGCMVELLETAPPIMNLFSQWRETCAAWSGGDPLVIL